MLPLTVLTICLSLTAGILAGEAERFVRDGGSYPDTPNVTVSAHSKIACSLKCVALEEGHCGGFRYDSGICVLYMASSLSATGESLPEENSTSAQPGTFRRLACPDTGLTTTTAATAATAATTAATAATAATTAATADTTAATNAAATTAAATATVDSTIAATTVDSTIAATTVDTTITTTITEAPASEGSVILANLAQEAAWPCDEASTQTDPEACGFMAGFASAIASALWKKTVEGECDLDRGRCKFPAVLSTTGAPRIEAWRCTGQFNFDMGDSFPSPPADLTEAYDSGPSDPAEAWKYDCSTTDSTSTVLTGFLGVARAANFNKNILRDMDLILCTRFTEIFLQVDPTMGESIKITANGESKCPTNHVITGVWDSEKDFLEPKLAKCSKLVNGTVNVDDPNCDMTGHHAASNTAIYWNACAQDNGPSVVTGLRLKDVAPDFQKKEWDLRCCPVTGPPTSTNVV